MEGYLRFVFGDANAEFEWCVALRLIFIFWGFFFDFNRMRNVVGVRIFACSRFVEKDRPSNFTMWCLSCHGKRRRN